MTVPTLPPNVLRIWTVGLSQALSLEGLESLARALRTNDERLIQGQTTLPEPLLSLQERRCEGACAIGLAGWWGDELDTVGEVELFFSRTCWESDKLTGEEGDARNFTYWFDHADRKVMLATLLPLVEAAIRERGAKQAA